VEDFANDPLGTLTKGWGLFSRAAVKTAVTINESYVQPSVAKVCALSLDLADDSYKILRFRRVLSERC